MQDPSIWLPDPAQRQQLEPFASVYAEVIVPEATSGGWFASQQEVPETELARISRRIEALNDRLFGHPVHPAIYVHALLICGHFFYQAAADSEAERAQDSTPTDVADAAFSLVQSLQFHHNLYDLYLLLG